MNEYAARTPWHLWLVAIIAVLWNAMGAYDYVATQLQLEFYVSQFTAEQLEYFSGFPAWMVTAWAVAIWASVLGSVGLLLRKAWAVWLFGAALVGLLVSSIYNFVLNDAAAVIGQTAVYFTVLIWVIALLLFFYARAMASRGVLRG